MAAPHVAGAVALLRQRHPAWTVAQIKSALVQSGVDATDEQGRVLDPRFHGGGVVVLRRADEPLVFVEPSALSFELLARGAGATSSLRLDDAGGGAGTWEVASTIRAAPSGAGIVLPATVDVPGRLDVDIVVSPTAKTGDLDGYVELRRGDEVRRVPFWGRVSAGALERHRALTLASPGTYRGTTAGARRLVSRYRYPETPRGIGVTTVLRGPERVYRFDLRRPVANFGVVVTQLGRTSRVEPRVVAGIDENRLTGYAGLPVNHNPYLDDFRSPVLAAGALSPVTGEYAVVFDSATRGGAGSFAFRFWVDDVTPPLLRLRTRTVARARPILVAATDTGSGVYPDSIVAAVDGSRAAAAYRDGVVSISTAGLAPGRHRLRLRVSDFQEAKNTENVARILPNTRWLTATLTIRR
jgi:hypothetical protein